jgi:hypothetical protein
MKIGWGPKSANRHASNSCITIGSTGAAGRAVSEVNVGWPRPG